MTSMRSTMRAAGLAVMAVAAALLLSGCFTMKMDLTVQTDDTVDGSLVFAVQKSVADLMGGEDAVAKAFESGGSGWDTSSGGNVETKPYRTDDLVGVEYVFDSLPLTQFSSGLDDSGDALSITRDGDTFVVKGAMDLTSDATQTGGMDPSTMMSGADVGVSITFPGKVISADGQVDGNTVTWTPTVGEKTPINAVGSANPGMNLGLIVGIALLVLLAVAAVVGFLLVRSRREGAVVEAPLPEGSMVPGAPAPVAAAAAPEPEVAPEPAAAVEPAPAAEPEPVPEPEPAVPTQVIPTGEQPTQVVDLPPAPEEGPQPPR